MPKKLICKYCKKDFYSKGRRLSQECCSKSCAGKYKKNLGQFKKGSKPWNIGKKHSSETIKKIKNNLPKRFGKESANWKGGITKINHLIRNSFENRLWTKYCMERDNYICQYCKIVGGNLEVHHLKSFSDIIKEYEIKTIEDARKCEELWFLDNGITLCVPCHIKLDKFRR